LHDPKQSEDVTIGLLCDGCRFSKASDLVEWDIFRTAILEGQGWKLQRLWTPHFVRDVAGSLEAIGAATQGRKG
jgi:very-short-patch-repair endonuclease